MHQSVHKCWQPYKSKSNSSTKEQRNPWAEHLPVLWKNNCSCFLDAHRPVRPVQPDSFPQSSPTGQSPPSLSEDPAVPPSPALPFEIPIGGGFGGAASGLEEEASASCFCVEVSIRYLLFCRHKYQFPDPHRDPLQGVAALLMLFCLQIMPWSYYTNTFSSSSQFVIHQVYDPVCAVSEDGQQRTYSNACKAKCAGAEVVSQGACWKKKTFSYLFMIRAKQQGDTL